MIYVFLADGFEETEAVTPIDYLRRCEELEVRTVGVGGKVITSSHGLQVIADISVFDVDKQNMEMIVLPGGMPGTLNLEKDSHVKEFITYAYENNIPIGAICAAPSILGHMGLLNGKKATCYTGFETQLGENCEYISDQPAVTDGNIITARGAGCANQFAFALAEKLCGAQKAEKIKASVLWKE